MVGNPVLFPADPIVEMDDAQARLENIAPRLRECVLDAFSLAKTLAVEHSLVADALDYMATRQKFINALVVARVRREFDGDRTNGVEPHDENGFLELRVGDRLELRFKHVDGAGHSRNTGTTAQRKYRNLLPLVGEDTLDLMRLTVGWRWDIAATEIQDIVVVFEKGDAAVWQFSILKDRELVEEPTPQDQPRPTLYTSAAMKETRKKKGG